MTTVEEYAAQTRIRRLRRLALAVEQIHATVTNSADPAALARRPAADAWARGGVHTDSRGRRTLDEFLSIMAWHDDNHLAQLVRALDGRP